jgi:hypothetical protein
MITQEQITLVLQHLPSQFSIGELVDKLVVVENTNKSSLLQATKSETWYVKQPTSAPALSAAKPQLSPAVAALRGIAKLRPEDEHKSYDELRWEAMRTRYEL